MEKFIYYTHGGIFHCDEVMGAAICAYAEILQEVVRLKDLKNIPTNGIIADIGREYNHADRKYDHHQFKILREDGFPYATAGLLWKHYHEEVLNNTIYSLSPEFRSEENTEYIFNRMDERLFKGIDAHDCDNSYRVGAVCQGGNMPVVTISDIVAGFNSVDVDNEVEQIESFHTAFHVCGTILSNMLKSIHEYLGAKQKFLTDAILDDKILIMDEILPWKEIVHEHYPEVCYVVMPSAHPGNPWSMFAVPVNPTSRKIVYPIERSPKFKGFIHEGQWIAGADTKEELVNLARYNQSEIYQKA